MITAPLAYLEPFQAEMRFAVPFAKKLRDDPRLFAQIGEHTFLKTHIPHPLTTVTGYFLADSILYGTLPSKGATGSRMTRV